jgi:hypothetical protein
MEFKTHWKFDDFYPGAPLMRKAIDDHFTESIACKQPFNRRAVWNYWYIPTLYAYFRAAPGEFFGSEYDAFMRFLREFAAREFGLAITTLPFLSMYLDGCVQNIHNDATNGRLAYVYSLTNWEARKFLGGETFVYLVGDAAFEKIFRPTGGFGFYDFIEPHFNRLGLFDDRLPHAVNAIQGTMNPLDARFALHGHMEEPQAIPFAEGGLAGADLAQGFEYARSEAMRAFGGGGCHGFVTFEVTVQADGLGQPRARHMQLLQRDRTAENPTHCVEKFLGLLSAIRWPQAAAPSTLVFALGAGPLQG